MEDIYKNLPTLKEDVKAKVKAILPPSLSIYSVSDGNVKHPSWMLTLKVNDTSDYRVQIDNNSFITPMFVVYYDDLEVWLEAWNNIMKLSYFVVDCPD